MPPSRKSHHFEKASSSKASRNGSNGLSAMSAQTKNQNSAVRSRRYLIRSQNASGLRVGRSSSRGRLVNCGPGPGVRVDVMSSFLHGPGIHDRVDGVLLSFIAPGATADEQQVQLLGAGIHDAHLIE